MPSWGSTTAHSSSSSSTAVAPLNLFETPEIQEAIEREYTMEFRPAEQFTDERAPIIFTIPKQSRDFTDLRRCSMKMKLRVKRKNGAELQTGDEIGLINMCHQTAWSQIDVTVNGVPVSSNTRLYPYKAFFKSLTRHAGTSERSAMKSMGWFSPYTGASSDLDADVPWSESKQLVAKSRLLELEGPLMEDIFENERYLLNGMEMQIKLHRCLPSFILNNLYTPESLIAREAYLAELRVKMEEDAAAYRTAGNNLQLRDAANESANDYNEHNKVMP